MYQENGFGGGGAPYEYVVAEERSGALMLKKTGLILLYVVWGLGLLVAGAVIKLILPLLAFIPITLWMLIYFTWPLTQVAYEYSFFGGELRVSRILGERKRRELATVRISTLGSVAFCGENGERPSADRVIFAASSKSAPRLAVAAWKNDRDERVAMYLELDDKALRILRCYNAAVAPVKSVK